MPGPALSVWRRARARLARRYNWGILRPDVALANYFFTQPADPPLRCALDLPAGELEVPPASSQTLNLNLSVNMSGKHACAGRPASPSRLGSQDGLSAAASLTAHAAWQHTHAYLP